MAFEVFISYSTRDIALATKARELLVQAGAKVYLAEYSTKPGQILSKEMEKAIKFCDLFILLWSVNSKTSEWVPQEIGLAKGTGRAILPIVLQEGLELPGFIKDLKYLAFYKDPASALAWLQRDVFEKVQKKDRTDGLVWLGIGVTVIWLLSQKK